MATASKKNEVGDFIQTLEKKAGQSLRPHQAEGVEFMIDCWKNGYGCILADEMGLGKTCQAVAVLSYLLQKSGGKKDESKCLIVCPLSVLDHWRNEPKKFGLDLETIVYRGDKDEREDLRQQILGKEISWKSILTTYELVINDNEFFSRLDWTVLVVDEAHRLKNMESVLHNVIAAEINYKWILLLTGTPVQNNLTELYSLLSLCHSDEFPAKAVKRFVDRFSDTKNEKVMVKLRQVLKRYVLRRTKDVVSIELPTKSEVVLFHDLTDLQKELYKAVLVKNYDVFEKRSADRGKQRLMNTLMQLRKCVGHPYLFEGIEPEPFEQGEHLVEASGKLLILDILLGFLKKRGHKVLLFSQMTRMLDIVQDYLTYREYTYERLDGSVRGEERFAAVQRFTNTEKTFCFLLSTKAGGLGLNLMAADTVIFLDSDFNPQNDLQAAARAHRMGQNKHVKIIRLVGRRTVEEIILARAALKLKFTNTILLEQSEDFAKVLTAADINEMLMFGLSEMGKEQRKPDEIGDADLEKLLGKSEKGHWQELDEEAKGKEWIDDLEMKNIYTFEGKDYREESKQADRNALDDLKLSANNFVNNNLGGGKTRGKSPTPAEPRQKRVYTEKELEEMREKKREATERRKLAEEENRLRKEEERKERILRLWEENDYESAKLEELEESDGGNEDEKEVVALDLDEENSNDGANVGQDPIFVIGDVTKPKPQSEHKNMDAIIVHCVDDSGEWGRGGVFTALSSISSDIESRYELAKTMKDLALGDVHLIEVKKKNDDDNVGGTFVALIVAQSQKKRAEIKLDELENGFKRLSAYASKNRCTVHMPRIGYGLTSFNWYGAERMIRKFLCQRGVPTYVYYFPRNQQKKRRRVDDDDDEGEEENRKKQSGKRESDEDKDDDEESGAKRSRNEEGDV